MFRLFPMFLLSWFTQPQHLQLLPSPEASSTAPNTHSPCKHHTLNLCNELLSTLRGHPSGSQQQTDVQDPLQAPALVVLETRSPSFASSFVGPARRSTGWCRRHPQSRPEHVALDHREDL
eukprot:499365-Hanusia_phi.AAC.1